MIEIKHFFLGEDKKIRLKITSLANEDFKITHSSYKLCKKGEVESEGASLIDEANKIISVQIAPKEKGEYNLDITYVIATETFIQRVLVRVA